MTDLGFRGAHPRGGSSSTVSRLMLVFEEGGKPCREPGAKPLRARTRTNNNLNQHRAPSPGIEPQPHWCEASALTTAPSLLQNMSCRPILYELPFLKEEDVVTVTIICNGLYPFLQNAVDEIEMATVNNNTVDNERTVQLMTFSQTTRVPQGGDETEADDGSSDYIEIIEYAPLRPATQSWEVSR